MGNSDSKLQYRKAIIELTTKSQTIDPNNEAFWSQFWSEHITSIQDIYTLIPATEIRALREEAPSNLSTLCFKLVDKIKDCSENSFLTEKNVTYVLNCVRLLTRLLPYIYEETEWRGFFWSESPVFNNKEKNLTDVPLAQILLNSIINLLFIPDFTVTSNKKLSTEELQRTPIDTCEYIWEAGVGFSHPTQHNAAHDYNRIELLKLLLTTFSETMYLSAKIDSHLNPNKWISYFTSFKNQNALSIFTSVLNIIFSYDPVGYGLPYNYLMFNDSREELVEICCQLLCVTLEFNISTVNSGNENNLNEFRGNTSSVSSDTDNDSSKDDHNKSNLFISYISRIHRDEDFSFILKGFSRLLNNPMIQTILPGSCKKINFYQELLILFWKFCDYNKKFLYYVLKSSEVLDIFVPILYFLIDSRDDTSKIGLMHICVFILLLLSGERNFGVRLNKPYVNKFPIDVPVFSGTHGDLLIIVFHKLITTTGNRLQPLYDCLLTIIANISPYLKSLSMVTSTKVLHLLEAFSNPTFLFSNQTNYYLIFFLLEILNNIIQYQFDGNSNMIYTIIRKRLIFYNLLNLQTDQKFIDEALAKLNNKKTSSSPTITTKNNNNNNNNNTSTSSLNIHGSPNTSSNLAVKSSDLNEITNIDNAGLKTTLAETPAINKMTENTISCLNTNVKEENSTASSIEKNNKLFEKNIDKNWTATSEWISSWKSKLPLQTLIRLLQVLVPQVEKICIDKGLTDESEILKFLQNGTLVGLLPVPHPILIRKYQPNLGTIMWLKTYMWGVVYLRNLDPPIFYDTNVKLFEIQRA